MLSGRLHLQSMQLHKLLLWKVRTRDGGFGATIPSMANIDPLSLHRGMVTFDRDMYIHGCIREILLFL